MQIVRFLHNTNNNNKRILNIYIYLYNIVARTHGIYNIIIYIYTYDSEH